MSNATQTTTSERPQNGGTVSLNGDEHKRCGAQHPTEPVTCALVANPGEHQHVGHLAGEGPLEERTVAWRTSDEQTCTERAWCSEPAGHTADGDWDHSSAVVDLAVYNVADDCGSWCWLTQPTGADTRVVVHIEGRSKPGAQLVQFELPAWQLETLTGLLVDDVQSRERLAGLLGRVGAEDEK